MRLEVDQSRKVEQTGPTVLACSNHESFSLLVPVKVKRQVLQKLRIQGRERRMSVHMVLAALAALLLCEAAQRATHIVLDDEYTGHRGVIKSQLLLYLLKLGTEVETDLIGFDFVGKNSAAHKLALSVYRGEREPDHRVTFDELWALVG